jgi:hypothetical protein
MIRSRKLQLVMVLVLACLCAPVLSAEPSDAKTELKFDIRNDRPPARHLRPRSSSPDVDTYYAVLFVRGDWDIYRRDVPVEVMLETSAGRSMSQLQREIISNQSVRFMDNGTTISKYTYFQLFGVGQDDVQKMVSAFIEVMVNFANKEMQHFLKEKQKFQELIVEDQKKITEKETEQKDLNKRLEDVKRKVHYLSVEEAGKAIEELNKTLDELSIEIAGMQRKLFAIREEHENTKKNAQGVEQLKIYRSTIWPRLEQMRIDQIIELKVAEEKQKTAVKIRTEVEEFYNLSQKNQDLLLTLARLRRELSRQQGSLDSVERIIQNPVPEMLPPKVFQNKVTIYPVKVED